VVVLPFRMRVAFSWKGGGHQSILAPATSGSTLRPTRTTDQPTWKVRPVSGAHCSARLVGEGSRVSGAPNRVPRDPQALPRAVGRGHSATTGFDPRGPGFAAQSFVLLLHCGFQIVDSISQILEPTFGVYIEPIEDLYGVIVGVL